MDNFDDSSKLFRQIFEDQTTEQSNQLMQQLDKDYAVKAFFKKCALDDRKNFPTSKCIMPISIGQKLHEDKKFLATIKLISRSFKECVILVDDTLQRHTMKLDMGDFEKDWYLETMMMGDAWLERNQYIYEQLNIPYTIIRWDKWLHHADYQKYNKIISDAYQNDKLYRKSVDSNIEDFLNRYQRLKNVSFDRNSYQNAFQVCLDYLKEECAAMCLWIEEGCHFEVYPTGRKSAMTATYLKFIQPFYPHLLISVSLYFKKQWKFSEKNMEKESLYCLS